MDYKSLIREVPDFPKPGILFYDITPLLKDPTTFQRIIDDFVDLYQGQQITKVVGIESRGFIFGSPLACRLQAGFVPVRKPGKLPADVYEVKYNLEYGSNSLAIHRDAIELGEKVLVIDDLLATGGTAAATVNLINQLGGGNCRMCLSRGIIKFRWTGKINRNSYAVLDELSVTC